MKRASLFLAVCLLLLPAAAMADNFSFLIGGGTLHNVGISGCPPYPPNSCGGSSNMSVTGAPISTFQTGATNASGAVATVTFTTPLLYSMVGTPGAAPPNTWVIETAGGGSVQVDAGAVLAGDIGVPVGTPIFTGVITNAVLVSSNFGSGSVQTYSFSAGVEGTYSNAFLQWAIGCSSCSGTVVDGTISLGNSSQFYHLPGGTSFPSGSLSTNSPAPEPATLSLLGLGLIGLLGLRRRS